MSELREVVDYWRETDFQAKAETTGLWLQGDQVLDFARSLAAARRQLAIQEQDAELVERGAKWMHRSWFLADTNPDDPEDFYPELWDEMDQEDRDWYLEMSGGVLRTVAEKGED